MPDPPRLSTEQERLLEKGLEEFNSGLFFECHDTLEELWMGTRGPARDFFQGLIQIAVGFYHLNQWNLRGAKSQLEKGLRKLEAYPECYAGVDVGPIRSEVRGWLNRVRRNRLEGAATRPQWRFAPRDRKS